MAMPGPRLDPYDVLGVGRRATAAEIRTAYRRLVQIHHPDHNEGSVESARRFEEIQEAYATVIAERRVRVPDEPAWAAPQSEPPPMAEDPDIEARVADLERQVREAHAARERARRAAREAAAQTEGRATDEELGYVTTEDSFSKVLADALDEVAARLKGKD
jgi:curved DNA-binding protein CbpA